MVTSVPRILTSRLDSAANASRSWSVRVGIVANIIDAALGSNPAVSSLVGLALFLPGLSVAIRRLHDTGRSGWWLLIGLVPFIGFFVLLYFFVLDSENDNQYGPYPKD